MSAAFIHVPNSLACRWLYALAPLANRKACENIVADLASGKLQQHSIVCFGVFDFGGFSHPGVCMTQGGRERLSDVSQLGFLHTLPGCRIQLKWILQWCWEECELSCL